MKDEIIAILDRSGSMSGYENDTIGGFNAFIKEQKELSEDCAVTLILFDDKYEVVYEATPIAKVPELTARVYTTRGMTALRDAVAKATKSAGDRFSKAANKPNKVIVYITTDGFENASKEFTAEQLKDIVKHQEEKYGWEYIYVGCDHDVVDAAKSIGIKSTNTIQFDKDAILDTYRGTSAFVANYRS